MGRGVSLPTGVYLIDVKAVTPDGQTAHLTVPHVITR